MGQTREKKASKRSLKAQRSNDPVASVSNQLTSLHIESIDSNSIIEISAPSSASYLAPPTLSTKTSHSSFNSSISSTSPIYAEDASVYHPDLVEIRHTDDKGFALFTTARIPRGTIILAEIPAIRLTSEDEADTPRVNDMLQQKFNDLSKTDQKTFKRLHDANKAGFTRVKSIYHSNCYNLDGPRSKYGGSCIGLAASRINHSCLPNVQFSFLEVMPEVLAKALTDPEVTSDVVTEERGANRNSTRHGVMVFRALKTIPRGKEVLSNYETIYATKSQRQLQLQMHYGFRCDCEACAGPTEFWSKSDDRRREMIKHRNEIKKMEKMLTGSGEAPLPSIGRHEEQPAHTETVICQDNAIVQGGSAEQIIEELRMLEALLVKEGLLGIELGDVRSKIQQWTNV